ncbi:hypothetical protein BU25DRAFT_458952 [Macroventuria anomochaeta]|uniref:Uncharacterized protein n=1 Tax=Macroventuria anomochaeta TaxID=301207 RepID=A0ACB6RZK5_9PLEO|nr:uncharacterized protein BU25DRAFT_458952 [Macroventuria anomochaeta]KAF2627152.1 hypothetical protein BU25DRAFT_458952 [Macroventuria anomochaeta]
MATYMYTSPTGSNWDDDDDDFSSDVYKTATEFSASAPTIGNLGPLQRKPAVEDESEVKQFTAPASGKFDVDYDVDPDCLPTYAGKIAEFWLLDDHRRPAYVELSHGNGYAYPHQRTNYCRNWLATKLRMRINMDFPMMNPSPLNLSMTWDEDGEGEYIKEGGFLFPSIQSPTLSYDSHSEEEQDEACTPPGSRPTIIVADCKDEVEEYDPVTGAIDLPVHGVEAMKIALSCEFVNSSHISDDLDIEDILGDAARNMLHSSINEPCWHTHLSSSDEPDAGLLPNALESYAPPGSPSHGNVDEKVRDLSTGATHTTVPGEKYLIDDEVADYNEPQTHNDNCMSAPGDSIPLIKTTLVAPNGSSPDLKYIRNPTNTSLVWNTVAAGWFTLSSVPWARIAVAAAGALVDVTTFVARC